MTHKGFTLVETMVAISLLAISLIGPYVAVQNAVQSSYVARDQLVASHLAQEGVEYVRSIRDNNYLNSDRNWLYGFNDPLRDACYGANPTGYCYVDPTQGDFNTNSAGMREATGTSTLPFLYISPNGLYNQQSIGTASKFKRLVRVYTVRTDGSGNPVEVRVVVHVMWNTGPKSYSLIVVDNIQDWI